MVVVSPIRRLTLNLDSERLRNSDPKTKNQRPVWRGIITDKEGYRERVGRAKVSQLVTYRVAS